MSNELNKLLYQTVIGCSAFRSITGATTADPRFYKNKTPIKVQISDSTPAFGVYRIMGSTKLPGNAKIDMGQKNDQTYSMEIFGKKDTDVEFLCVELEDLFYEQSFFTDSLRVGYTWATRGALDFDDGRQLWLETMTVYFTKILKLTCT